MLEMELRNDNWKMLDQAGEESLMARETEPERDIWESLCRRFLEKIDSHEASLGALSSDQVHRKGP